MPLPERAAAERWLSGSALDRDGQRLGRVTTIYGDLDTHLPEWVLIDLDDGAETVVVPLYNAQDSDEGVRVSVTRSLVFSAPRVGSPQTLTTEQEGTLYRHYGIERSTEHSTSFLPADVVVPETTSSRGAGLAEQTTDVHPLPSPTPASTGAPLSSTAPLGEAAESGPPPVSTTAPTGQDRTAASTGGSAGQRRLHPVPDTAPSGSSRPSIAPLAGAALVAAGAAWWWRRGSGGSPARVVASSAGAVTRSAGSVASGVGSTAGAAGSLAGAVGKGVARGGWKATTTSLRTGGKLTGATVRGTVKGVRLVTRPAVKATGLTAKAAGKATGATVRGATSARRNSKKSARKTARSVRLLPSSLEHTLESSSDSLFRRWRRTMFRIRTLLAIAVGYVLGARAGRDRYEQIVSKAREFSGRPEVQQATQKVKDTASNPSQATDALKSAADKVRSSTPSSGSSSSSDSGLGTADYASMTTPTTLSGSGLATSSDLDDDLDTLGTSTDSGYTETTTTTYSSSDDSTLGRP